MASGEVPSLKIIENSENLQNQVIKTMKENPKILLEKYLIKNGEIIR